MAGGRSRKARQDPATAGVSLTHPPPIYFLKTSLTMSGMSTVICEDFRLNVIRLLEKQGITRSQLARRIGCSPSFVSQILNGDHEPGLRVVEKFAAALGVRPETLLKKIPQSA